MCKRFIGRNACENERGEEKGGRWEKLQTITEAWHLWRERRKEGSLGVQTVLQLWEGLSKGPEQRLLVNGIPHWIFIAWAQGSFMLAWMLRQTERWAQLKSDCLSATFLQQINSKWDLYSAPSWSTCPGNYIIKAGLFKAAVLKYFGPRTTVHLNRFLKTSKSLYWCGLHPSIQTKIKTDNSKIMY